MDSIVLKWKQTQYNTTWENFNSFSFNYISSASVFCAEGMRAVDGNQLCNLKWPYYNLPEQSLFLLNKELCFIYTQPCSMHKTSLIGDVQNLNFTVIILT